MSAPLGKQDPRAAQLIEPTASAHTLSAHEYLSPEVYEKEREAIFARTWQVVARTADLTRPGDFVPATILDEPIVIVHDQDGKIAGFHNVCRHRAGQVALSKGNRKSLQCRYHGWTYGLDGALKACQHVRAGFTNGALGGGNAGAVDQTGQLA